MTNEKKVQYYQNSLREIGEKLISLSDDKHYIHRLINNHDLLPFDRGLRNFIEHFRK